MLRACVLCGNEELYKKKDFPHWLGLTILVIASVAFLIGQAFYWKWLAWTFMLGLASVDALLYVMVSDVVVCYRCGAHHRGVPSGSHQPFDLSVAERYRQARLRQAQLQGDRHAF
jgi:hypothetical protein